jgi:hypothetical protein
VEMVLTPVRFLTATGTSWNVVPPFPSSLFSP